jgi:hypothetical protein
LLPLQDQRKEFLMLFMAIASHKLISGLALSSRFLKDGATMRQVTTCGISGVISVTCMPQQQVHERQCNTAGGQQHSHLWCCVYCHMHI